MDNLEGWIWMDGEFVPWKDAKVHVLTHTFHYGTGVFEGVRAYKTQDGTAIFRLNDHTRRFLESATIMNMRTQWNIDTLCQIQKAVVRKNKLEDAYIRPMMYYGCESMGLHADKLSTHCLVAAWKWGTYLGEDSMEKGISVKTSSIVKLSPVSAMNKAKVNGHYFNSMLALNEVQADGYDEALLLDGAGFVAEGSGENIFFIKDEKLITPSLTYALDGITRRTIVRMAHDLGVPCEERSCTRDELYSCDEAFFTGTAAEVTPIHALDNRTIGQGTRGPITTRLQKAYFDIVHGRNKNHSQWLAFINDV